MTANPRQTLAIAFACVAIALTAGCGGSEEPEGKGLPAATASELERRLDEIERRYREAADNGNVGACDDIQNDSIPAVNSLVSSLPDDVDPDVRQALEESFDRLEELAQSECSGIEPAPTETQTETTPTETVPETDTTESTTETAPETTPEEAKPKKDKEDDEGGALPAPVDPTTPGQGGGAEAGDEG